jgi:3'(2'), 5'-bisphosphate nucleotidase
MAYEHELETALEAAELAGRVVMEHYERFEAVADAPASITTDADREAQEVILGQLRRRFPTDALSAEESTATLANAPHQGPRLWIVDPIDGTRGFARKNGEFSVMIAFVDQGHIAAGLVLEPARGRLTYAARDLGCWRRDGAGPATRCRVSDTSELSAATLTQSRAKKTHNTGPRLKALAPARVLETYSAGIKLALVARGEVDLYVNAYRAFHDWDICAGHILVTEAGGRVTGLGGQALEYGSAGSWQRHGVLATNGHIHQAALAALAQSERKPS